MSSPFQVEPDRSSLGVQPRNEMLFLNPCGVGLCAIVVRTRTRGLIPGAQPGGPSRVQRLRMGNRRFSFAFLNVDKKAKREG